MKLFSLVLVFVSFGVLAEEQKCGEPVMVQPGGKSLQDAQYSFKSDLEVLLNDCTVQEYFPARAKNEYYIRSFS